MSSKSTQELKEKARTLIRKLAAWYGTPAWNTTDPMNELILTILSQNTNDRNRDRAYSSLKARFPTWEQVRQARLEDVTASIRSAGLANQKAARIQDILQRVSRERGDLSLAFLRGMPAGAVRDWLLSFKGVGRKTAAIVMQFSLGMPAFPVDTHVYRVSGRLGLRPDKMDVEHAHAHLEQIIDPRDYGPAHLNLIRLGREVCHPHDPECSRCPLGESCDYARREKIEEDLG